MIGSSTNIIATFLDRPGLKTPDLLADFEDFVAEVLPAKNWETLDENGISYDGDLNPLFTGNGMPDVAELGLLDAVLKNAEIDFAARSGVVNQFTWEAWAANLALAEAQLGTAIPALASKSYLARIVAAYMTLGEYDSVEWINVVMDTYTSQDVLNPEGFDRGEQRYFKFEGDADNDGAWNINEWEGLTLTGVLPDDIGAYTEAALDPAAQPISAMSGQPRTLAFASLSNGCGDRLTSSRQIGGACPRQSPKEEAARRPPLALHFYTEYLVLLDVDVLEGQVRGRIVALEVDRAGAGNVAVLAVVFGAERAGVVEVAYEVAVDPDRGVVAVTHDGLLEPFVIAGNDLARVLVAVVAAGAEVVGGIAVVAFPVVANLGLVALPEHAHGAAEEYAAVKLFAVGNDVELEDEVLVGSGRLELAVSVGDVDGAVFYDEHGLLVGDQVPAVEVFTVEEGGEAQGAQLHVLHGQAEGVGAEAVVTVVLDDDVAFVTAGFYFYRGAVDIGFDGIANGLHVDGVPLIVVVFIAVVDGTAAVFIGVTFETRANRKPHGAWAFHLHFGAQLEILELACGSYPATVAGAGGQDAVAGFPAHIAELGPAEQGFPIEQVDPVAFRHFGGRGSQRQRGDNRGECQLAYASKHDILLSFDNTGGKVPGLPRARLSPTMTAHKLTKLRPKKQ